jgi:hypothetical protein
MDELENSSEFGSYNQESVSVSGEIDDAVAKSVPYRVISSAVLGRLQVTWQQPSPRDSKFMGQTRRSLVCAQRSVWGLDSLFTCAAVCRPKR